MNRFIYSWLHSFSHKNTQTLTEFRNENGAGEPPLQFPHFGRNFTQLKKVKKRRNGRCRWYTYQLHFNHLKLKWPAATVYFQEFKPVHFPKFSHRTLLPTEICSGRLRITLESSESFPGHLFLKAGQLVLTLLKFPWLYVAGQSSRQPASEQCPWTHIISSAPWKEYVNLNQQNTCFVSTTTANVTLNWTTIWGRGKDTTHSLYVAVGMWIKCNRSLQVMRER